MHRPQCSRAGQEDQLEYQIQHDYYRAKGTAITNFADTLPAGQSQLAIETLKNPYNFDFLGLEDTALEREIESAMMQHITRFLLEMGKGFAFVGRQYAIQVSETEYFIDLLFYHLHLRCFVIVELLRPAGSGPSMQASSTFICLQ